MRLEAFAARRPKPRCLEAIVPSEAVASAGREIARALATLRACETTPIRAIRGSSTPALEVGNVDDASAVGRHAVTRLRKRSCRQDVSASRPFTEARQARVGVIGEVGVGSGRSAAFSRAPRATRRRALTLGVVAGRLHLRVAVGRPAIHAVDERRSSVAGRAEVAEPAQLSDVDGLVDERAARAVFGVAFGVRIDDDRRGSAAIFTVRQSRLRARAVLRATVFDETGIEIALGDLRDRRQLARLPQLASVVGSVPRWEWRIVADTSCDEPGDRCHEGAGGSESCGRHSWTMTRVPGFSFVAFAPCHPAGSLGPDQPKSQRASVGCRFTQPWLRS
jgi:hypothetical protein